EKSSFTCELGCGKNGGKPYTTYLFKKLKVESKSREMRRIEAELAKERDARLEAEQIAEAALMHCENMSRLLRESLDIYHPRVAEELQAF
ncbi:GTPase IMAP member 7, partial [Datura stramonium]|nr:GTPase IMAP member 7 [Datura stramonium]